jgi:hypothetical protein
VTSSKPWPYVVRVARDAPDIKTLQKAHRDGALVRMGPYAGFVEGLLVVQDLWWWRWTLFLRSLLDDVTDEVTWTLEDPRASRHLRPPVI